MRTLEELKEEIKLQEAELNIMIRIYEEYQEEIIKRKRELLILKQKVNSR